MSDEQMDFLYFGDREEKCRLAACVNDLGELRHLVSAGDRKFRLETDKGVFEGDGLTTIPADTFRDCKSLSSAKICFPREGWRGLRAFMGCEGLTSLTLPCDLGFVGDWAFAQCGRLKKVSLKSCPCIAPTAFEGCFSLRELRVPHELDLGNLHLPPDVNVIRV